MGDVVLANYMVGLIAVACFLVCSFVFVVWNTYVCSKMKFAFCFFLRVNIIIICSLTGLN